MVVIDEAVWRPCREMAFKRGSWLGAIGGHDMDLVALVVGELATVGRPGEWGVELPTITTVRSHDDSGMNVGDMLEAG